jgi:hypothetical protein
LGQVKEFVLMPASPVIALEGWTGAYDPVLSGVTARPLV